MGPDRSAAQGPLTGSVPLARAGGPYRAYARVAAAAFVLVALYTVAVKGGRGELDRDWMHSVLHVATGGVAAYAGWVARTSGPAKALTLAVGSVYGALGLAGWFVDGLLMGTSARIPLAAADNAFHLVLAAGAALAVVAGERRAPPAHGRLDDTREGSEARWRTSS